MSLKKNNIYQGDCVKQLAKLDEGSVDLVFADPPFNIGYDYDVYDDAQSTEDYLGWCEQWITGVHRALKPTGTFWLAIGDEYAAELKIASQKTGFHCRSWVIWYYTFGVNCRNGFSRSHTHLFHFVKDKKKFTFNRVNPQIRVKSARQLVYADNRANPNGRLPDNTWITRPQDAPDAFSPHHDTWYFTRVAGTFKEREGFHGCQMPEQLLARIIRSSSHPQDLVLDPFGGSGTTLSVAKKLGRQWMGFELSKEYAVHIKARLDKITIGDPINGPEDAIESAPSTGKGKKNKKKAFDNETVDAVIESYVKAGDGFPVDHLMCDKDLNKQFIDACLQKGLGGNADVWNRLLMNLRKAKKLPPSTNRTPKISASDLNVYGYASEVAWRLITVDFGISLDELFCSPDIAAYFDRLAQEYGPQHIDVSTTDYRRAAFSIRKQAKTARSAAQQFQSEPNSSLDWIECDEIQKPEYESPGVFIIASGSAGLFAGEAVNVREHLQHILENQKWQSLEPDLIFVQKEEQAFSSKYYSKKSALVAQKKPILNSRVWLPDESTGSPK